MNRQPAVAGLFYSEDEKQLRADVLGYLDNVSHSFCNKPKALILPHAGYIYSAHVACYGYSLIKAYADNIKRIVLVGPSHRTAFYGIAVSTAATFSTPLGKVALDEETIKSLVANDLVKYLNEPHLQEHCLEVHLPFLQMTLKDFQLIPLIVGLSSDDEVSAVIDAIWRMHTQNDTLIIISSDLSHYLSYSDAQSLDSKTATAIEQLNTSEIKPNQACGAVPICGLLKSAKSHKLKVTRLALCNSGDTAGNKESVVGYGTFVFN